MSSLIEQAALRLEQLRNAGVAVPRFNGSSGEGRMGDPADPIEVAEVPRKISASSQHVELDLPALAQRGILTPSAARSQTADQFRVIKRPLIANVLGKGASRPARANLIMITSALAGEGKTF